MCSSAVYSEMRQRSPRPMVQHITDNPHGSTKIASVPKSQKTEQNDADTSQCDAIYCISFVYAFFLIYIFFVWLLLWSGNLDLSGTSWLILMTIMMCVLILDDAIVSMSFCVLQMFCIWFEITKHYQHLEIHSVWVCTRCMMRYLHLFNSVCALVNDCTAACLSSRKSFETYRNSGSLVQYWDEALQGLHQEGNQV